MSEARKGPSFEELYRQLRALPPNRNGEIVGGWGVGMRIARTVDGEN